jgi:imidazolonepropionase-like amidohydrolase
MKTVMGLIVLAGFLAGPLQAQTGEEATEALAFYGQEVRIIERLLALGADHPSGRYAFRHANIVDVTDGSIAADQRVMVGDGRILSISPDGSDAVEDGYVEIDASDRYLSPGLVDMHVHQLLSADVHLLNLANGITTVRDLDGFDWMLRWREQSRRDEWIAPDMIVTGTIIAAYPMGIYAVVAENDDEARTIVRQQADAGYDYIKVHNRLPIDLFDAVTDEARRIGIGVVGHVPHDISVAHALSRGMETLEHLKGYINDRNLQINDDDWLTPTRWSTAWNTPTLYTNRQYTRGDAARAFFASEEARYLPVRFRNRWSTTMDEPLHEVFASELENRNTVIKRLLPVTDRFLAGTDSGSGGEYMVPGFALHTELEMLQEAGLSTLQAIRSATANPALATGREQEFGRVAVGLRASLLLLDENPLQSIGNLRSPRGVMLRGRWFDHATLDRELKWLAKLYATEPGSPAADALVTDITRLSSAGYVWPAHQLEELAAALDGIERRELAASIRRLQ